MSEDEKTDAAEAKALPSRRFEGREDFRQLVRDALETAAREGWRELILSDATFGDWPLGERVVVESLRAWSRSGRTRLRIAAATSPTGRTASTTR